MATDAYWDNVWALMPLDIDLTDIKCHLPAYLAGGTPTFTTEGSRQVISFSDFSLIRVPQFYTELSNIHLIEWCVEVDFYLDAAVGEDWPAIYVSFGVANTSTILTFGMDEYGGNFSTNSGAESSTPFTTTTITAVWHNLTLTKTGSSSPYTYKAYVDGVLKHTWTSSFVLSTPTATDFILGSVGTGGLRVLYDNLRVTLYQPRYTTTFTPPDTPHPIKLYDTYYNDTSLILHMNGANNGTTFSDSSKYNHTVTANGNAKTVTAGAHVGNSIMSLDGVDDFLEIPWHNSFYIYGSAKLFTLEAVVNLDSTSDGGATVYSNGTNGGFQWYLFPPTAGAPYAFFAIYASSPANAAVATPMNTLASISVTRSGDSLYFFVDGRLANVWSSYTTNYSESGSPLPLRIGIASNGTGDFKGKIQEVRITKGICRHTTSYVPSARPFPDFGVSTGIMLGYKTLSMVFWNVYNTFVTSILYSTLIDASSQSITSFDNGSINANTTLTYNNTNAEFTGGGQVIGNNVNADTNGYAIAWEFLINTTDTVAVGYYSNDFGYGETFDPDSATVLTYSYVYKSNGDILWNNTVLTSVSAYSADDVIGIIARPSTNFFAFYKNGVQVWWTNSEYIPNSITPYAISFASTPVDTPSDASSISYSTTGFPTDFFIRPRAKNIILFN